MYASLKALLIKVPNHVTEANIAEKELAIQTAIDAFQGSNRGFVVLAPPALIPVAGGEAVLAVIHYARIAPVDNWPLVPKIPVDGSGTVQ